ncbi:MAG: hypothetical protein Q4C89_00820 [Deinococcus sp.]|uniref:hypothetical protein n=1 Tax=Deinococcus sp. TaxID=47478 RepID=UPI0026DC7824|nr:hypothetical protein [Deinococcus sp.]MDO4244551.1 hypothetical protein [Deinococcus sp.]
MDNLDITPLLSLLTKGGPAAVILAVFYGLAMLVREVRGGKVGQQRENDLAAKIALLESQVKTLTVSMEQMEAELEKALDLVHSMRYQRDQARIRVEYLEQLHDCQPRTVWPPEPQSPPALSTPAPAGPFPPLPDEPLPPT